MTTTVYNTKSHSEGAPSRVAIMPSGIVLATYERGDSLFASLEECKGGSAFDLGEIVEGHQAPSSQDAIERMRREMAECGDDEGAAMCQSALDGDVDAGWACYELLCYRSVTSRF